MRILHVFREPTGGLFRHVLDLVRGQHELGHETGILCDSTMGGEDAVRKLKAVEKYCTLGITRRPIHRAPGASDLGGIRETTDMARAAKADILHGHGAKGGFFARLAGRRLGIPATYTPHGGSLNYDWLSPTGAAFLGTEWMLARRGCGFNFVCEFERETLDQKIGIGRNPFVVTHNGLWEEEFHKVTPAPDAADLLFMGVMREVKGVDILLEAVAILNRRQRVTVNLVGGGYEHERYKAMAQELGLSEQVKFLGFMPAAEALTKGRLMIIPSRKESFPYVVLEAAAAEVPMIVSNVGGIPEILPPQMMFSTLHGEGLSRHIAMALAIPEQVAEDARQLALKLRNETNARQMTRQITDFYATL